MNAFYKHMANLCIIDEKIVIGGDFNVIYKDPDDKIDTISFSDKASLLDYDIVVIGINKNIIDNTS